MFSSNEEKIEFQANNIEYLVQMNYELQAQLNQYQELFTEKVTPQIVQSLKQQLKDCTLQLNTSRQDVIRLQKQLDSIQKKPNDKKIHLLEEENLKLKNEIKQLKLGRNSSKSAFESPVKLNPNVILRQTQDLSKDTHLMLLVKGNGKWLYIEESKNYENIKLIKQLKNGLDKSYFDSYHVDHVSNELQKSLLYLERYHGKGQGRDLLGSNQLVIIFGGPCTHKKSVLIQYIDILSQEIKIERDFKINVKITYSENINGQIHNELQFGYENIHPLPKDNQEIKKEGEKKHRQADLFLQQLKLTILNKLKMNQKDPTKYNSKIRQLIIDTDVVLGKETMSWRTAIFSSNHIAALSQIKCPEEAIKEFLQCTDKGKLITELLKRHSIKLNIILAVKPLMENYKQTLNTFQLAKVIKTIRFVQSPTDKFSQILENQVQQLEYSLKNTKEKLKSYKWEAYRAKQQLQTVLEQNAEAVQKNYKIKEQFNTLLHSIQLVHSGLQQTIQAKQSKSKKGESIKSLELAQKSIGRLISQPLDQSISPTKIRVNNSIIKPSSSESEEDIVEQSEEEVNEPPRKESIQSMI